MKNQRRIKMIEFEFSTTGNLYNSPHTDICTYRLKVDIIKNMIRQINPYPNAIFKPSDGWKRSNEPEEHLDEVGITIQKNIENPTILCFSYKDISLAERLKGKNFRYSILFDEKVGIIKKSPDEILTKDIKSALGMALKKYDLLIMRHYLEHYVGAEEIVECISKIIERSGKKYAYIEVPDCSKFISQKNPCS